VSGFSHLGCAEGDEGGRVGNIRPGRLAPGAAPERCLAAESTRQKMVAALGRHAMPAQVPGSERPRTSQVHAVYRIDAGEPVVLGQIRFEGNRRLLESFSAALVAQEGDRLIPPSWTGVSNASIEAAWSRNCSAPT
jgi:hypothetical protein